MAEDVSSIPPCKACGSQAPPEFLKPLRYTPSWWFDPRGYWSCPNCERARSVVDHDVPAEWKEDFEKEHRPLPERRPMPPSRPT